MVVVAASDCDVGAAEEEDEAAAAETAEEAAWKGERCCEPVFVLREREGEREWGKKG